MIRAARFVMMNSSSCLCSATEGWKEAAAAAAADGTRAGGGGIPCQQHRCERSVKRRGAVSPPKSARKFPENAIWRGVFFGGFFYTRAATASRFSSITMRIPSPLLSSCRYAMPLSFLSSTSDTMRSSSATLLTWLVRELRHDYCVAL